MEIVETGIWNLELFNCLVAEFWKLEIWKFGVVQLLNAVLQQQIVIDEEEFRTERKRLAAHLADSEVDV